MNNLCKHIDLKNTPITKKNLNISVLQNICMGTLYMWTWSIGQFICLPTVRKGCKRVFNEQA